MGDAGAEKIARNNSVFREANDQIEAAAADVGLTPDGTSPFICECSDPRCLQIIRLTLEQYRDVRRDPRRFVHAPGHETHVDGVVRPLEHHDGFTIVEKIGEAGSRAAELASEGTET